MGIYFNPDNNSFRQTVRSRIYIDKTGLLEELNKRIGTEEKCIALSHARRFGKSQAAGMIDAYYSLGSDSKELFSKFEISGKDDFEEYLNKFNVIHIDVSSVADFHKEDLVETILDRLYEELSTEISEKINYEQSINFVLNDIYRARQIPFVIIIDEWDCVIRNHADRPDLVHKYMQFLHALFKSEEAKSFLALAYITGILPIKKIEDESALNNFREYTMLSSKQMTKYFGFTTEEVKKLCAEYDMDFDSVKEWYNGYLIDKKHMYNPNSVYCSMVDHSLESYWKNTSSFQTINKLITLNMDGLKEDIMTMLSKGRVAVDVSTFQNDLSIIRSKNDALTALIHLGYLGYDSQEKEAFIPNYEIATAYKSALQTGSWNEIASSISRCDEILKATINGDADKVAEILEQAHETYTSILEYNNENALSCAITMAYFTAPAYYTMIRELPTGKGYADIAMIPRADAKGKPAILVELKWNRRADTAIKQIREKRYTGSLKGYGSEILLAGITYDKKSKKHKCKIERISCL